MKEREGEGEGERDRRRVGRGRRGGGEGEVVQCSQCVKVKDCQLCTDKHANSQTARLSILPLTANIDSSMTEGLAAQL